MTQHVNGGSMTNMWITQTELPCATNPYISLKNMKSTLKIQQNELSEEVQSYPSIHVLRRDYTDEDEVHNAQPWHYNRG